jgi:sucrose-6-phosphate hydrolase SacC (GH32 family)
MHQTAVELMYGSHGFGALLLPFDSETQATMMECPDIFALGDSGKWMLIGSLYSTNQWWIGTVEGSPPVFTPESVGIMDYGNGCVIVTTGSASISQRGKRGMCDGRWSLL